MAPTGVSAGSSGCSRARVNSLWSVWYCALALSLQLYILAGAVRRFSRHVSLPWGPRQPYLALNTYVAFVGASVVLLPCFAVAAVMRVGNLANDGVKLRAPASEDAAVYQNLRPPAHSSGRCLPHVRALWKHSGPTAPFLHMCIALCLYAPKLILSGQLIKYGFLPKGEIWHSDLDFILPRRTVEVGFLATVNKSSVPRWPSPMGTVTPGEGEENLVSPEFLNYASALVVYAVRYPSVFWRTNKCYALLFSLLLSLNAVQTLLFLSGFAVLHRLHVSGVNSLLPRVNLIMNAWTALLDFLLYNALMLALGALLYLYGTSKFGEWQRRRLQRQHVVWNSGHEACLPQLLLFSAILALGLVSVPMAWDLKEVYRRTLDSSLLFVLGAICIHLGVWLLTWLFLTLKTRWHFFAEDDSLAPTVSHAVIKSVKEGEEIELAGKETPLLVIENGHTYQIRDKSSKQAIVALAQESSITHKPVSPSEDDDVYWLKPKPPSPKDAQDSPETERMTWMKHQRKASGYKVTFDEMKANNNVRRKGSRSPKIGHKSKRHHNVTFDELTDSDDGDYATLRDNLNQQDKVQNRGESRQPTASHTKHGSDSSSGVHSLNSVERRSAGGGDCPVILHKPPDEDPLPPQEDTPDLYGRATNVRLTSFTDASGGGSHYSKPAALASTTTHQRRDSANFSLASSNESENCNSSHHS